MSTSFEELLSNAEKVLERTAKRTERIYQRVDGWIEEYPEFSKLADEQMHTFWPWDEHVVANDINDLKTNMTMPEREATAYQLCLFTHYEMRAGDDYWIGRIARRFKRPEMQRFATMFAAVEYNSHAPFYSQANEVLQKASPEFYSQWRYDPVLKDRMDFIEAITSSKDDLISIAGFTFVEGAILYSSFAFFKHFQAQDCNKNLIKNFCRGINMSVGDENTHAVTGAVLFRRLMQERNLTAKEKRTLADVIYETARKAYEHECQIIRKTFSFGEIEGITAQQLIDFVKHRIDLCLNNLGLKGLFEEEKTDTFIEEWFYKNINAIQFHDFFTGGGSEYDANWARDLFGEVFDPESPNFSPIEEAPIIESYDKTLLDQYLVYGKDDCRFCDEVKSILQTEDIPFTLVKVGTDCTMEQYSNLMKTNIGHVPKTVPQVFRVTKNEDGIKKSVTYIGGGEDFVNDLFAAENALEVGQTHATF